MERENYGVTPFTTTHSAFSEASLKQEIDGERLAPSE